MLCLEVFKTWSSNRPGDWWPCLWQVVRNWWSLGCFQFKPFYDSFLDALSPVSHSIAVCVTSCRYRQSVCIFLHCSIDISPGSSFVWDFLVYDSQFIIFSLLWKFAITCTWVKSFLYYPKYHLKNALICGEGSRHFKNIDPIFLQQLETRYCNIPIMSFSERESVSWRGTEGTGSQSWTWHDPWRWEAVQEWEDGKLSAELQLCELSVTDLGIDLGVFIHLQVFIELSRFIWINKKNFGLAV